MSMPKFSAQASLYQVSRIHRAASGLPATAAVQPAWPMHVSFHCNGPDPDINWSCEFRWWVSPTCGGYSQTYADGTTESGHWCY
jgi:hypothetical protein